MTNMLEPKALAHAKKELDFDNLHTICYLLGNGIDAFNCECDIDDYDIFDESDESILPHITYLELPKGVQLVGLMSGDKKKIGLVNFGPLSFRE